MVIFIANFRYRIVLFLFLSNSSAIQFHPFIYCCWDSINYARTTDYHTLYPIRAHTDENLYRYFNRLLRQKYNNGYIELGSGEISAYRSLYLVCCLLVNAEICDWHFQSYQCNHFYVMPLMFLLAPLLYRYIDMNIIFIQIDTFAKSLFVMFMGIVFTAISIRIVEGLTQKIGAIHVV